MSERAQDAGGPISEALPATTTKGTETKKGIELTQAWLPRLLTEAYKATPHARCINLETKQLHHCGLNTNQVQCIHIIQDCKLDR